MTKRIPALLLALCLLVSTAAGCGGNEAAAGEAEKAVYVIGDYNFTETVDGVQNVSRSGEAAAAGQNDIAADNPGAIVISPNSKNLYLQKRADELNEYLVNGNILFFPETTYDDANQLFEEMVDKSYNMLPVDSDDTDVITAYVFMDRNGAYYTGCIISPENTEQEIIDGLIVEITQNNQEVIEHGKAAPAQTQAIGYEWNALTTWHQNTYSGDLTNDSWFSEWLCFYSTKASGDHYYAFAGEWNTEGAWSRLTDKVKYQSDADSKQSGVLLRDYEPKMTPSTTEASFNFSLNSDSDYDFGFSQSWSTSNLKLTDNTAAAYQYCKLTWTLTGAMAQNTCTGRFFMIFKDEDAKGSYTFHHYRYADQTHSDQYDEIERDLTSTYKFIA